MFKYLFRFFPDDNEHGEHIDIYAWNVEEAFLELTKMYTEHFPIVNKCIVYAGGIHGNYVKVAQVLEDYEVCFKPRHMF